MIVSEHLEPVGKEDYIRSNVRKGMLPTGGSNPFAPPESSSPERTKVEALQPPRKRPRSTMPVKEGGDEPTNDRVRRRVITRNLGKTLCKASCLAAILVYLAASKVS